LIYFRINEIGNNLRVDFNNSSNDNDNMNSNRSSCNNIDSSGNNNNNNEAATAALTNSDMVKQYNEIGASDGVGYAFENYIDENSVEDV
jgi:hypothetical protein